MTTENFFGKYSEEILGFSATIFSPIYRRVTSAYWNNAEYSRVKRNYYYSDYEKGIVETFIPTFQDPERNMKWHRIIIKTTEALDNETLMTEATLLEMTKNIMPVGTVDSTTIFVVSPRLSKRGFIHARKLPQNTMACPIISKDPKTVFQRILMILMKFYEKRLKALIEAFHLEHKLSDWHGSLSSTLYYIFNSIVSKVSSSLENGGKCLLHVLNWLSFKFKELFKEIDRETRIKIVLKELKPFKRGIEEAIYSGKNSFSVFNDPLLETSLVCVSKRLGRRG